jgi:hypothetical protein
MHGDEFPVLKGLLTQHKKTTLSKFFLKFSFCPATNFLAMLISLDVIADAYVSPHIREEREAPARMGLTPG